jgi:iron complex transport system permease protein
MKNHYFKAGWLSIILVVSIFITICYSGIESYSVSNIFDLIQKKISNLPLNPQEEIIWDIRLPRAILAILIGTNLSLAGLLMQALFHNPLADPYITGTASGAALFGVIGMSLSFAKFLFGYNTVIFAAFAGAMLTCVIVMLVAQSQSWNSYALLLVGIAIGTLMQSLTSLLMLQKNGFDLRALLIWLMGSLAYKSWEHVWLLLPYSLVGFFACMAISRQLNALALGDSTSHHLGIDIKKLRLITLFISCLLTASAVAISGVIGFVGLIIPNLMRKWCGANHFTLIPLSALAGSLLVLWSDGLARWVASSQEIPIGIFTGIIGCLFFLYLIWCCSQSFTNQ